MDWQIHHWEVQCKNKIIFLKWQSKKADLQNLLDIILKIDYPFISKAYKYTSCMKKVSYNDANIKIQVVPKFLPDGEEDMTEMIIGYWCSHLQR